MNTISKHQYAVLLNEALHEVNEPGQDIVIQNFIVALTANNDLAMYPEIIEEYEKIIASNKQVPEVASIANPASSASIVEELNSLTLTEEVDKEYLGDGAAGGILFRVDKPFLEKALKGKKE